MTASGRGFMLPTMQSGSRTMRSVRLPVSTVLTTLATLAVWLLAPAIGAAQPGGPIGLVPVVTGTLVATSIQSARDGSGRLFVAGKTGEIFVVESGVQLGTPFLDLSSRVSSGGEQGLLGLAFHPDYANNGFFFVHYTDLAGDNLIARYSVSADPNVADAGSASTVLTFPQPHPNHNGGDLAFGPDGFLYISVGDGAEGGLGDPFDNAQSLTVPLGKILRIDIDGGSPYAVPPSNPFVGVAGAFEEIWARGLRNPWRISFDSLTGDLYIADVGQFDREEVDFQPAGDPGGQNYGWARMEGTRCFDPPTGCNDGSLTLPVVEYQHASGDCAITGGHVYRGNPASSLYGRYFYADLCTGHIWTAHDPGTGWVANLQIQAPISATSFGYGEHGELYIGGVGSVFRIAIPPPTCEVEMSQSSYALGEQVEIQTLRFTNLDPENLPVQVRLQVHAPPAIVDLLDFPGTLPGGFDQELGPVSLFAVDDQPAGTWFVRCAFEDPQTGAVIAEDGAPFNLP